MQEDIKKFDLSKEEDTLENEVDTTEVKEVKKKNKWSRFDVIFNAVLIVLVSFSLSLNIVVIVRNYQAKKAIEAVESALPVTKSEDTSDEFKQTEKILEEIEKTYEGAYVGDIDYDNLTFVLANAMISTFGDKYGIYLDPDLAEEENNETNNTMSGIGVLVRAEEADEEYDFDRLYVIRSYDGSDAKAKGIEAGCLLTKIDGKQFDFEEITYSELIGSIRGEAGTFVNLTYIDTDGNEHTVDIERMVVDNKTITYEILENNIGYISIEEFNANTDEEFTKALEYMKENNISKVIFDLRDNSGGLLDTVVNMLDDVLPQKEMLYIQDKDGNILQTYSSDKKYYDIEGICIINGDTASAAELFTKSLQENGNFKVLGSTSYGKGTVCSVIPLSDGGTLQISTFRYLTSSKECIEGVGVIPDEEIELSEEKAKISYKLAIEDDDIIMKAVEELSE